MCICFCFVLFWFGWLHSGLLVGCCVVLVETVVCEAWVAVFVCGLDVVLILFAGLLFVCVIALLLFIGVFCVLV